MTSNRYPLLIFITALCLIAPASLWAQSSSYNMEHRFVQRLTWVGDEYAARYEVIIEKEENGKYKRVLHEFTTNFFIEVSLSSGKYRFQVIPYDLFNLPVPETEWMNFEVQHHEIMANPDESENKNEVTVPSHEQETVIEYKNQFNIYVGLAWIPILSIYGESESFGGDMTPSGAGLRLAIFSVKQKILNLGMEGNSSWHISMDDDPVQSLTFDLNAVLRFSDVKVAVNAKIGAGLSLRSGASPVSASGEYAFYANLGVSSVFWLPKRLYLEFDVNYVQFFINSGLLRPSVGFGYRF